METILVVEDEKDISQMLCVFLESGGYRPVPAFDGVTGLQLFCQEAPDLIILDLLLPKLDGYSLCRAVREKSDVPVIMLTALSDEENQLKGYDLLADDYVTKPFSIGILLKKVEALLRRQRRAGKKIVSYKSVILDKDSYRVTVEGKEIFLTGKEFELLYLFLSNPHRLFTKEGIMEKLWKYEYDCDENIIYTHMKNLRKKLGVDIIKTIRGVGYKLD